MSGFDQRKFNWTVVAFFLALLAFLGTFWGSIGYLIWCSAKGVCK